MTNGQPHPDDLLSAHHDGELTAEERDAVERLLDESPDARAELEDYRALTDLLRELPTERVPAGFRSAVKRRIERESLLAAPSKPARPVRGSFRSSWLLIGGSLGAAAALMFSVGRFDRGPARDRQLAQNEAPATSDATAVESASRLGAVEQEVAERLAGATSDDATAPLLKANGGAAMGSSVAKPPEGFKIGDMYAYLEQTGDGDVMVVQATVVDVRKALDQMQVLLTKNSIPTMQVSTEMYGREDAVTVRNDELALYVESEPTQMNAALAELNNTQNLFVQVEYAGILDPDANVALNSQSQDRLGDFRDAKVALDVAGNAGRGAALGGSMRPQARASVADNDFGERPAAPVEASRRFSSQAAPDSAFPQPALADSFTAEAKDAELEQNEAAAAEFSNGYQTVLNVPRGELLQQLNAPKPPATSRELADEAQPRKSFYAFGIPRQQSEVKEETLAKTDEEKSVNEKLSENESRHLSASSLQFNQRRLRLLVVLEPQASGVEAIKVKSAPPASPVEAPAPSPKKG